MLNLLKLIKIVKIPAKVGYREGSREGASED